MRGIFVKVRICSLTHWISKKFGYFMISSLFPGLNHLFRLVLNRDLIWFLIVYFFRSYFCCLLSSWLLAILVNVNVELLQLQWSPVSFIAESITSVIPVSKRYQLKLYYYLTCMLVTKVGYLYQVTNMTLSLRSL